MKERLLKLVGALMIVAVLTVGMVTTISGDDPPGIGLQTKIEQLA